MTFCKNYHFHSLTTALMFRFRMRLTVALAALCSWCLMFLMFLMLSHANAACRTWRHEDNLRIVRNHAIWDWIILIVRLCYSRLFQGLFSFQIPYLSILKYLKGFAAHVQFRDLWISFCKYSTHWRKRNGTFWKKRSKVNQVNKVNRPW